MRFKSEKYTFSVIMIRNKYLISKSSNIYLAANCLNENQASSVPQIQNHSYILLQTFVPDGDTRFSITLETAKKPSPEALLEIQT